MGYFWAADTLTRTQEISATTDRIQVFPNPAVDVINIVTQENIVKVNAYAMDGALVQLRYEVGNTYSVGHLPPGIYLIVI